MKGEILSIETAEKLARFDKVVAYLIECGIDDKMMELVDIYDVNGIEIMDILLGRDNNE